MSPRSLSSRVTPWDSHLGRLCRRCIQEALFVSIASTAGRTNVPRRDVMVSPSGNALVSKLHPLDGKGIELMGGFWADRQQINRDVSLRNALRELEDWGALPYLRAAAERARIPEVKRFNLPHVYKILDSDVYKWLEAA